jgi:hypothetical protein
VVVHFEHATIALAAVVHPIHLLAPALLAEN